MPKLEPCPFCGGQAEFERLGTSRQSCIVTCTNCGCRLESNEEGAFCGDNWNRRNPAVSGSALTPSADAQTSPETNIVVSGRVREQINRLWITSLLLVLVTGFQVAVAIMQLLLRYGVVGG